MGSIRAHFTQDSEHLAELRRLGLDDETLVVFTSDNGSRGRDEGGSNAPLRGNKGQTWEGGMRLPCIARWPGVVPAGRVSAAVSASIDLLPTFAGFAGATVGDQAIDADGEIGADYRAPTLHLRPTCRRPANR